jgi:hypothetical protein
LSTLSCSAHWRKNALAVPVADRMRSETPPTPRLRARVFVQASRAFFVA